jgi:hypothetical protein
VAPRVGIASRGCRRFHLEGVLGGGVAVKDRRQAPGRTQEGFVEQAGIHRTYFSHIGRGTRNVSLLNIERVAQALLLELSGPFRLAE